MNSVRILFGPSRSQNWLFGGRWGYLCTSVHLDILRGVCQLLSCRSWAQTINCHIRVNVPCPGSDLSIPPSHLGMKIRWP